MSVPKLQRPAVLPRGATVASQQPAYRILRLCLIVLCLTSLSWQHSHAHQDTGPSPPHPFDFGFPDHLCGSLRETYLAVNERIRTACKEEAANAAIPAADAAAAAAAAPTTSPGVAAAPSAAAGGEAAAAPGQYPFRCRTLSFDSGHDGFGDTLAGLASSFLVALLSDRAFVLRQEWLPHAFEPAAFDWRPSDDIPHGSSPQIKDIPGLSDLPATHEARLSLYNQVVDPQPFFSRLANISHLGLVWNRGLVHYLFENATGEWGDRFRGMGMSPPYGFACVIRFLLRPRPEVWQLMRSLGQQLHREHSFSVGLHIRVRDELVWQHSSKMGLPREMEEEALKKLIKDNQVVFDCAQRIEDFWAPRSLKVKWFLMCNAPKLKQAFQAKYPDKILVSDFVAHHVSISKDPNTTNHETPPAWIQETVAEWLLLASADALVIPNSGLSKTAAMYSMHPTSVYMPHRCIPDSPVPVGEITRMGCGM